MQPMAEHLSDTEVGDLVSWLTAGQTRAAADWAEAMLCPEDKRAVDLAAPAAIGPFGVDAAGSRRLSAEAAGLTRAGLATLEPAWAIGFPDTNQLRASPAIVGSTLFYHAPATRKVLALDAGTGCAKWIYEASAPLRSSVVYGELPGGAKAVIVADALARVHVIDAASGVRIWMADGRASNGRGIITGAPLLHGDRIIVPISDSGVGAGANPRHECCVGHGAVTALSAIDGKRLWEWRAMPEADYTGEVNSLGVRLRGPSGAPVWASPVIDEKRGHVVIATGENTSHPATDTSDAVIALDLETGKQKWLFQALPNDVWNMACDILTQTNGPNCPIGKGSVLRDFDFGAAAIVAEAADGRDLVIAGQKSGDVWALDAATGALVWNTRIGDGSALGGVHWGIATDGTRVFAAINDPEFPMVEGYEPEPGMYALDLATGARLWSYRANKDCPPERAARVALCDQRYGFSAAPIVVDGAVVAGTLDGKLFVFDGETGAVLREFDTTAPLATVNGVPGRGGAIDSHSVAAGAGHVFVGSGYASFDQAAGNMLIALKPAAAPGAAR
jgi:polyvinyl alcohol dehydrogenase (cytochrome)